MASPVSSEKLTANLAVTLYDFDPNGTTAVDVAWVDMRDFEHFMVGFFRTIGTGALDTFAILGNSASDGSGTDVTIVSKTISSEPDAVGDYIWLECTAEQIRQEGEDAGQNLRYVTASVEFATGTDEGVIIYVRQPGRFAHQGLTADLIA